MSFGSEHWMYSSGTGSFYDYSIDQSLRIDNTSGSYLTISSASPTATNRKKVTISCWVKRSLITDAGVHTVFWGSTDGLMLQFFANDTIYIYDFNAGSWQATTTRVWRDCGAWMHLALIVDTSQSTAADRAKFYVNGELLALNSYPQQDNLVTWHTGSTMRIGGVGDNQDLAGYIAEFISIDGQDVAISDLAETKDGVWVPKDVSGLNLGAAGFYLKFNNKSDIGNDSGSNNIDFTPTNITQYDIVLDSPTRNWCHMNPLSDDSTQPTVYTRGNLGVTLPSSGGFESSVPTFLLPRSGQWYWEFRTGQGGSNVYGRPSLILADRFYEETNDRDNITGGNQGNDGILFTSNDGGKRIANSDTSFGNAVSANDIIGLAYNADTGQWFIYINNTIQNSGTAINETIKANFAGKDVFFMYERYLGGGADYFNFGQDSSFGGVVTSGSGEAQDANGVGDFFYTPPSGYLALASTNLPTQTIDAQADTQAGDHFSALLWSGNGASSRGLTGVGHAPDWVWIKTRNNANEHQIFDSVRGVAKDLESNSTAVEQATNVHGYINSFDSDGFTVVDGSSGSSLVNYSSGGTTNTYVSWNWAAGGTAPTKTYKVVVVSDSGNKYRFRNSADSATFAASAVTLNLQEGGTYTFDVSDSTVSSHPFVIGTAANSSEYSTGVTYKLDGVTKTYSEYTSGFSSATSRQLIITVAASAPTLYYWCSVHSGMGGQINTNSSRGSTNFDGTILSVVSANQTSGFSILSYTGTGANGTIGHGLSSGPEAIIIKARTRAENWLVYHKFDGGTDGRSFLNITTSGTFDNGPNSYFQDTPPTSSVFYQNGSSYNVSTDTYIAYCFHSVEGFSRFGTFKGNSETSGVHVNVGFRPAWVMIKSTSSGTSWMVYDNKRLGYNADNNGLYAEDKLVEATDDDIDFLSNGFKLRRNSPNFNQSTYIYFCFAESSFKFSRAR